ncbi:MAG: hypothetical protein ACT4PT_00795 [Methanobacteriota archaeon]
MPSRSLAVVAAVLAAGLIVPSPGSAQLPDVSGGEVRHFAMFSEKSFLDVPFLGSDVATLLIQDQSYATRSVNATPVGEHPILIRGTITTPGWNGWSLSVSPAAVATRSGDTQRIQVKLDNIPGVVPTEINITIRAEMPDANGTGVIVQEAKMVGRVKPFYGFFAARNIDPPRQVGPYELIQHRLLVKNAGLYPDTYELSVNVSDPDWQIAVPGRVSVEPGAERIVNVTILSPSNTLFTFGENLLAVVVIRSAYEPTSAQSIAIVEGYSGLYVSQKWHPILALFVVCGLLLVHRGREERELRALEDGRPRPVTFSPVETAELAVLSKANPAAYKARLREARDEYKRRMAIYRRQRKDRHRSEAALEREQRRRADEMDRLRRTMRRREEEARRLALKLEAERMQEAARADRERRRAQAEEIRRLAKADAARRNDLAKAETRRRNEIERLAKERVKEEARLGREREKRLRELEKLKRRKEKGR